MHTIIILRKDDRNVIITYICKIFNNIFISMVPIVELRGAIPIAESLGLNIFIYYPVAIIGNMLPVPIIYLFARKVLEWGKDKKVIGKFFTWCLEKGEKGGEKIKRNSWRKRFVFCLTFICWYSSTWYRGLTGTLAASFLNIDFKTSISAVTLGVLLAGIIMSLGSKVVSILGWPGLIAIIAVILILIFVFIFKGKRRINNIL